MAATVIATLVAVFAVVTIFKYLLSTEVEEENRGCFRRRVLRAIPVQALKIIVVVWQIVTQVRYSAREIRRSQRLGRIDAIAKMKRRLCTSKYEVHGHDVPTQPPFARSLSL